MKLLVTLESISLVHGDVLVDKLVYLFIHVVGQLSSDESSVTEDNENQKNQEPYDTKNYPQDYM